MPSKPRRTTRHVPHVGECEERSAPSGLAPPSGIAVLGQSVDDLLGELNDAYPIDSSWFVSDHAPDAPPPQTPEVDSSDWVPSPADPDEWGDPGGSWAGGSSW